MPDEEEEISIDLSKITKLFKKKKDSEKIEEELDETRKEIDEKIDEKEEKVEDLEIEEVKEIEDIKKLEEDAEKLDTVEAEVEKRAEKIEILDEKEEELEEEKDFEEKELEIEEGKISEIKEDIKDEEVFDFGKLKDKVKGVFKKGDVAEIDVSETKKVKNSIAVEFGNLVSFFHKNKYILPIILILIAILFSTFFRMYPASLPMTDDWATSTVYNYYQNQIKAEIDQQYPNLPEANKEPLVLSKFQEFLENNKEEVENQILGTSLQFKSEFQDENGDTYLLAIDPYHWYSMARNYEISGGENFGDDYYEDGTSKFSLRNGREGKRIINAPFNSWVMVQVHKITKIFDKDKSLMSAAFLLPVILIGLSIIPAFFIAKKVSGNLGGFFAAMIVALNAALLGRTPAGFSDTDPYNIIFPLFIMWFFLMAFEAKDWKKSLVYVGLAGFVVGIFAKAWSGWWYIFDFILATLVIYILYQFIIHAKELKEGVLNFVKQPFIKNALIIGAGFIVSSGIFVSLFLSRIDKFITAPLQPLDFMTLKDVAVNKLWPNVLTTVAEFNEVALAKIVVEMGGNFMFWISLIGISFLLLNRKKMNSANVVYLVGSALYYVILISMKRSITNPFSFIILISIPIIIGVTKIIYLKEHEDVDIKLAIFLTIWFIGAAYGFTKGMRFAILMVPAFAIAFGVCVGMIYEYLSKWIIKEIHINKYITRIVIVILLCLFLIAPLNSASNVAKNEIPSMNDAWYNSLTAIKEDSEDGIITSWWDFGHWFYAIAERKVTFDGADQGERIHWVGKSLLTNNEEESIGILRMLNCGQEQAPHVLESYLDGDTVKAISILDKIILQSEIEARQTLKNEGLSDEVIEEVIEVALCDDLIDQYYITSDDMIGKAGVWGHFGSWDFERAKMWQTVRKIDFDEGIIVLKDEFGLSEEEANNIYYEIQNTDADQWVSGWPGYLSGLSSCRDEEGILTCENGLEINLESMEASILTQQGKVSLRSLAYIDDDKNFVVRKYEGSTSPYSAALLPSGETIFMDPLLVGSMFTRLFFFNGHGLEHFSILSDRNQVTGGRIQVWKVNWGEGKSIDIFEETVEEEPTEEEIDETVIDAPIEEVVVEEENKTIEFEIEI